MKTKKKNVFIGPQPPPLGGVAVINQNFQSLDYDGYDNLVFNTSNNNQREDLYKGLPWKNIINEYKKNRELKNFLKKNQPDIANVFVTSGYSIIRDIYYLKLLKKHKIPIIIHFHSKKKGEFALKQKRIKRVGKLFNKYANKIVLLSKDHFNYFVQFFDEDRCEVIENFVDYDKFENSINDKTDEFLYVGRLSVEKGFFDLLEACLILKNRNKNLKINVLGAAPNLALQKKIEDFVKDNQLENLFVFHGLKYEEEKYQIFKRSKIFLFPTHFENSPVVLKEAIAAKMAIISSDIEPNMLILSDKGNSSNHKAKNPEHLAEVIDSLIEDSITAENYCLASEKIKDYDKTIAQQKLKSIMDTIC